MRVFLTGATGFVGSAIVQELIRSGHQVLGLARSDATAKSLVQRGAEVHRGDLDDLESLRAGAQMAQAVIHTAFNHDFSKFRASVEADRRVIEALGAALEGSKSPLIVTSAIGVLPRGRLATEETAPATGPTANPRAASEEAAAAVAARGVRVSVVRLPPSVHGDGDHGFVPILIRIARDKGASVYADEGRNLWPAVHRLDAAHLYRLVLEKGATSAKYHAVAEEGVQFRDIAGVIGRRLNVPVVSKNAEEAAKHFGWFAHFAAMDIKASSQQTRRQLGWQPEQAELLLDLDRPSYFGG
jgi:nucleoside-diphosphate-sugar epimerase